MAAQHHIRELRDEDIDQVVAIWHAAGVARPWNDPLKDITFARRDAHSTILVAEIGNRVVATAMVGEDGHRGWVYYLATDPQHQGQGLGRAMMQAAEAWLIARGVWKLQLLVREENTQVFDFYGKFGFRDTRTVCMQKVLQP